MKFMAVFIPRHALNVSDKNVKSALKVYKTLLQDDNLQVRLSTSTALISLLGSCPLVKETKDKLQKSFHKLTKTKLARTRPTPFPLFKTLSHFPSFSFLAARFFQLYVLVRERRTLVC